MTKIYNKKNIKNKRQSLRNNLTNAEKTLWKKLRNKQLKGFKFRRQHSIGKFIVDFYCPKLNLVIEIDGDSHFLNDKIIAYDQKREKYIEGIGNKIIRFSNLDIYNNLDGVLINILQHLRNNPL